MRRNIALYERIIKNLKQTEFLTLIDITEKLLASYSTVEKLIHFLNENDLL